MLRVVMAGIGTTLDEITTCEELTSGAAAHLGCTAAVLRIPGENGTGTGYEAVSGDASVLPDTRWAAATAARGTGTGAGAGSDGGGGGGGHRAFWAFWAGARPALSLPLASGGQHFGVLVCARTGLPFIRHEAEALALLAERAASHIRHAREHHRVSHVVADLQRALLAEPGRPHPNLDVAIRHLPAGKRALVGGDWCETVRLHFGRTLLVVGDVMGHGVEAAVDMTAYRQSLRVIAAADLPPHRVLRQLDDIAAGEPDRRPATCLIARVDPVREQITLASAGHLPPAVIGGDGRTTLLDVPVGPPLGTGLGGYEAVTHPLDPARTLLLFTDGLVEHRGEDIDHSLNRLAAVRFTGTEGVESVLDTVLSRLDAAHAEDDVAVLAASPHGRREERGPLRAAHGSA